MIKLQNIPATRYDGPIHTTVMGEDSRHEPYGDGGDIIVWVGLDVETVQFLVNGTGRCPSDDVSTRLKEMIEAGQISIDREYSVAAMVSVSGMVYHTVKATNGEEAVEKVHKLIDSGDGLEDFIDACTVDDINIEEVEVV